MFAEYVLVTLGHVQPHRTEHDEVLVESVPHQCCGSACLDPLVPDRQQPDDVLRLQGRLEDVAPELQRPDVLTPVQGSGRLKAGIRGEAGPSFHRYPTWQVIPLRDVIQRDLLIKVQHSILAAPSYQSNDTEQARIQHTHTHTHTHTQTRARAHANREKYELAP